jgi:sugar phosphate isomerase/epimerase
MGDQGAMRITRRMALAGGAAAAMAGGAMAKAGGGHGLKVGLQLYAINPALDADFDGALKQVADIGYKYVEYAGLHGRTPQQMRDAFDKLGLKCPSAHFPPDQWLKGSAEPIAIAKTIGASTVICPMPPIPQRLRERATTGGAQTGLAAGYDGMTLQDWTEFAAWLNKLGADAHAAGLAFAYHNHNIDFRDLGGGKTPIELILHKTDPKLVNLEVDLGWVAAAGVDPAKFLERHAERVTMVHLKDMRETKPNFGFDMAPAELGNGVMDWKRILRAAAKTRARYGFIEQEPPYNIPPLESAKISFDYITKLQKQTV